MSRYSRKVLRVFAVLFAVATLGFWADFEWISRSVESGLHALLYLILFLTCILIDYISYEFEQLRKLVYKTYYACVPPEVRKHLKYPGGER